MKLPCFNSFPTATTILYVWLFLTFVYHNIGSKWQDMRYWLGEKKKKEYFFFIFLFLAPPKSTYMCVCFSQPPATLLQQQKKKKCIVLLSCKEIISLISIALPLSHYLYTVFFFFVCAWLSHFFYTHPLSLLNLFSVLLPHAIFIKTFPFS